jgi:DNA-binding transcriptional LysR family regulator
LEPDCEEIALQDASTAVVPANPIRADSRVPGSVLRFGPQHGLFKVLPVHLPRWRLPIAIITPENRTLSPAAQLFIDHARELAKPFTGDR